MTVSEVNCDIWYWRSGAFVDANTRGRGSYIRSIQYNVSFGIFKWGIPVVFLIVNPFTDEAQTALFKDPVRTAL